MTPPRNVSRNQAERNLRQLLPVISEMIAELSEGLDEGRTGGDVLRDGLLIELGLACLCFATLLGVHPHDGPADEEAGEEDGVETY